VEDPVSEDYPKPGRPSSEALAALAGVAQALGDPERLPRFVENPASEVDGWEDLPPAVQDALTRMSIEELALLGRWNQHLIENGFYGDTDFAPLSWF
jgi:hypothetical protein